MPSGYSCPVRFPRPLAFALVLSLLGAATSWAPHDARADFSAGGRNKKKGGNPGGAKGGSKGGTRSGGHQPGKPRGDDSQAGKGPSAEVLIARYTGIVLSQPAAVVPLQRLAQLYRDRDGNLKKLIDEFEKKAADTQAADRWNARVALAGIYKQDGRYDDAIKAYGAAIADRPKDGQARLALAQLLLERGDKAGARKQYDEALSGLTAQVDKEATLRSLRSLALDAHDVDAARGYHAQLVKLSGSSLLVKAELGRELLQRGDGARAEEEFKEVMKSATGDNRALAPALLDLGRAQAAQKKNAEALETLKRALSTAGSEAGVRSEILRVVAEVYRADNNLAALVGLLEKEHVSDFQRLSMLGSLYEETGQVEKAIATYRRALGVNSKNIETRMKIVRLLQAQGELDKAIAENEKLIQAAPRNPDFVFQLCETLLQRGDRAKALDLLSKLERSASNDEDVLTRVADFYERIEEKDRAMKIFARLTSVAPGDPAHLVELGDRYWQAGDRKKAVETWNRIRTAVPNKGRALTALGDVLLDHDMVSEALAVLKEATDAEPTNMKHRRSYAMALERAATGAGSPTLRNARFDEARAAWDEILEKASQDRLMAREARTHLVTLWGLLKQLEQRAEPLKRRLADDPPDLEAGRLLAEVQVRLRKLPEAEATLARITEKAPGDEEAFLALERVRMLQHNVAGAIETLGKLAEINPKRAREYYQRMAQYSAELYKDDDAIKFAEKAVALSPNDADGHRKLGEMYRRRGDNDKAIAAFRQAVGMNDRLFAVYMELAELLVAKGESDEGDRLYRRVIRAAPDEELVAQAGRLSMQRNLVKGSLTDLENELLPLSLGHPNKRVYRRLLIEVYGHMAFPLMQRVRFGAPQEAEEARKQLVKIGARGVKPLLDALADEQKSQVNTAIEVLAFVGNRGAAPALASFATGAAEQPLRVRAMVATGALRDPGLLGRYEELVAPKEMEAVAPGDPVTVAAAWAVARMGDRKALPLLERMLSSGAPEVRAFGAIGLGLAHEKKALPRLEALARAPDGAQVARAAAALAMGELGDKAASPTLVALATGPDPFVRSAALGGLARLGDPQVAQIALPALFAEDEGERRAAAASLVAQISRDGRDGRETAWKTEALPVQTGPVDTRSVLEGMLPSGSSPASYAHALVALQAELGRTAAAAAAASPDQAQRVADALLARSDSQPAMAPFTDGIDELPAAEREAAERAAGRVRAAVVPAFAALVRHPSAAVKIRAIRVLEGRGEDAAVAALTEALADADPNVLRAALAAVQRTPLVRAAQAVGRIASSSPVWSLRVVAAEALGPLAARERGEEATAAFRALGQVAQGDSFAVVREAALRSLVGSSAPNAGEIVGLVARSDPDPELRAVAAGLAGAP
jgi:cellulose synthase operon protein C